MLKTILLLLLCLVFIPLALGSELETTRKNIKGQKYLFTKGWFIITSPVQAWDYAIQNHETSQEAFSKAISKIKANPKTFGSNLKDAKKTTADINKSAKELSDKLSAAGSEVQQKAFKKSSDQFQKAWSKLNLGYLHYAEVNQSGFENFKKINSDFFGRVGKDFKDIDEAMEPVLGFLLKKSEVSWKKHFKEGKYSFRESYEKSGSRSNSMAGLWDILVGYASWAKHSIIRPAGKTVYQETKNIPYYTIEGVLKTFVASFNIIHSLGANLYYSSKFGYNVISPSLESGYLASLALLNAIHGSVSGTSLKGVGLINKVAVKGIAPAIGTTQLAIEEVSSKAETAATFLIHGAEASGEVFFEKAESGVVLGYSAISQIPPQLLLTAANSAIFLIYDGPRLILAKISGAISDKNVVELPVGSVMDIEKMKAEGITVEPLSEDPVIIKKVMENVE